MLFPLVIGGAGLLLGLRFRPHQNGKKRSLVGPKTGRIYPVDDFATAGVMIVHGKRAKLVLKREASGGGFQIIQLTGEPNEARTICKDFT